MGKLELLPFLVPEKPSADPNLFERAVNSKNIEMVYFALEKKLIPNAESIYCALKNGKIEILALVLEHLPKVEKKKLNKEKIYNCALESNNPQMLDYAIEKLKARSSSRSYQKAYETENIEILNRVKPNKVFKAIKKIDVMLLGEPLLDAKFDKLFEHALKLAIKADDPSILQDVIDCGCLPTADDVSYAIFYCKNEKILAILKKAAKKRK